MKLLEVENLSISFKTSSSVVDAVKQVSFSISEGETLGLVGESGSGKSVTAMSLLGLLPAKATQLSATRMTLNGQDLRDKSARSLRGDQVSMIFQDPMTSLNPHMRLDRQLEEVLTLHTGLSSADRKARVVEILSEVGIPDPAERVKSYAHEFSGGMRQRVMIAMAMLTSPRLLIADEPTTALDVTVQQQILDLMKSLQAQHGTSILFISHDLAVVSSMANRIAVMWNGELVEQLAVEEFFSEAEHPYTRALIQCHPGSQKPGDRLRTLEDLLELQS